jgi:hypothetical protein
MAPVDVQQVDRLFCEICRCVVEGRTYQAGKGSIVGSVERQKLFIDLRAVKSGVHISSPVVDGKAGRSAST